MELRELLNQNSIIQSNSEKSSPWQNGYQESFYGKFKEELGSLSTFETLGEAIAAISYPNQLLQHKKTPHCT
jgi:hypothetical protein